MQLQKGKGCLEAARSADCTLHSGPARQQTLYQSASSTYCEVSSHLAKVPTSCPVHTRNADWGWREANGDGGLAPE